MGSVFSQNTENSKVKEPIEPEKKEEPIPEPVAPKAENDVWTCDCGQENKSKFCIRCGKPRKEKAAFCPNCGKKIPEGSAFCGECGTKIE